MKKTSIIALASALVLSVLLTGCHPVEPDRKAFDRIMVYCGLAYNNLNPMMAEDITQDLFTGDLPGRNDGQALFVFYHGTATNYDYSTPNPAYLYRVYRDKGITVRDTIKVYDNTVVSASAETIKDVLSTVKGKYTSDSYGLVLSSHATGWLPANTPQSGKSLNSIGAQYHGSSTNKSEIDIKDFAKAIPFKLDYIALDCCLMGCIEVAAELKDVCDHIIFSPTEILTDGFDYSKLALRLLLSPTIDLEGVARDYYNRYVNSGSPYATVTLVDCKKIDAVSSAMASITSAHREELNALVKGTTRNVQPYFYSNSPVVKCFYDMRDIAVKIGATDEELSKLDSALGSFIECEFHTEKFFDLKLSEGGSSLVCGVSMYLPSTRWPEMNSYYTGLAWNKSVKVIDK